MTPLRLHSLPSALLNRRTPTLKTALRMPVRVRDPEVKPT